jgi:hypothetical protein
MKVIWNDAKKKCNISDSSFEEIVDCSDSLLSQEDKDFILSSFNAGMYNYVVEYVYNKSVKILQDVVFSIGEDIVVNITHWIDRSYISNFFDIFVLRLACDFDLVSKKEKLKILQITEVLQKRSDNGQNTEQIDKEKAKYYIISLFDAILIKDFSPFTKSVVETLDCLKKVVIVPYSETYTEIMESSDRRKSLFIRIMFAMLKTANENDEESYKVIFQNAKNLFPFLWDTESLNEKKFIAYYLKTSDENSLIKKVFSSISEQIKLQDFNTDVNVVTKILKSCQEVLSSHFSVHNHNDEVAGMIKLGEIEFFPNYFLRSVITPCLVTYLGNENGYINDSRQLSSQIFEKLTQEKWTFYFKNFFLQDDFVQMTLLLNPCCLKDWCSLVKKMNVDENELADEDVKNVMIESKKQNFDGVTALVEKIYYR